MRRSLFFSAVLLAAGMAVAGENPPAGAPVGAPLGATVERCKKTPEFCRALIREAKNRATAEKDACVPNGVSDGEIMGRVMRLAEEVLEEDPELSSFSYATLASQLIVFFYPCDVVA